MLSVAVNGLSIASANPSSSLPSATSVVQLADSHDRAAFAMVSNFYPYNKDWFYIMNKDFVFTPHFSSVLWSSCYPINYNVTFIQQSKLKEEPMDVESLDTNKEEEEIEIELSGVSSEDNSNKESITKREAHDPKQNLQLTLQRHAKFLDTCREVKVRDVAISRWTVHPGLLI